MASARDAEAGINGKMSEISAAMGLCLLDEVDHLLDINHRNYQAYREAFQDTPGLELLQLDQPETQNCQYIVTTLAPDSRPFLRDLIVEALWKENVLARKYFHPGCHRAAPYLGRGEPPVLPVTDDLCRRVMVLPTGTAVQPDQIQQLAECVRFLMEHADEIQRQREQRA